MTPDVYIWEQSEPTRGVLDYLHSVILLQHEDIRCTIKWKVLNYELNGAMIYLNPSRKLAGAIEVCFARARKFSKYQELLNFEGRKIVGGYMIDNLESIDEEILVKLVNIAIETDIKYKGTSSWKL